jgi:2,4-dienoyl-CoA reductase-like NADH-dependent reductase (Old Yellow Enzyme family)
MNADANSPAASTVTSALFAPLTLRGVTLANRIVVSPMCQYVADDGSATDWHLAHLVSLAISGAGLAMVEATAVERLGRITPGCLGLYSDANEAALKRAIDACRKFGQAKMGIQLGHAGRKASAHVPWKGGGPLAAADGAWPTVAPSPVPMTPAWPIPQELDRAAMDRIREAFVSATQRAVRLGFDVLELHGAHGYLLHEFFSPISNRRTDEYGGSLENRMRFPLEVAAALRPVWPADRAMGLRISGSDWLDGGADVKDAIVFAQRLKALGVDYVCVSSGGIDPAAKIPVGPGYQVPLAGEVRRGAGLPTRAVGMIVEAKQADGIISSGDADMVALARAFLDDPRWPWHAADILGATISYPPPYERTHPAVWPGSRLIRPDATGAKRPPRQ